MSVSLLFPAYNRLEFTSQSWAALMRNTDWSLVSEFHVYDDDSERYAGTWLSHQAEAMGIWRPEVDVQFHFTYFHSPMGVTLDWIHRSRAPILAKLDNDTIYPPGWLNIALDVMSRRPKLDMLGLEAMRAVAPLDVKRDYLPAKFISGLGLYRRAAFEGELPKDGGYFGLEEFQIEHPRIKTGWILPSLPVFLLDRLPMEPWAGLSREYIAKGWQRPEGAGLYQYKPSQHDLWDWWEPIK